ncbi:hypothetical protein IWW39_004643 [Coemansia spiralis]|uniref:C2H2-type domain-containing protein n=1 Tax=Coemansia spiralis TaxID=417178 RepID=A0A9W8GGG0_9FUNG|nr:hypothetical protein IWW39_004643 [Coemansia spiralis]
MVQLSRFLTARGYSRSHTKDSGEQSQPANFLDLSDDTGHGYEAEIHGSGNLSGYRQKYNICLPSARNTVSNSLRPRSRRSKESGDAGISSPPPPQRRQEQLRQRQSRGISWADVQDWALETGVEPGRSNNTHPSGEDQEVGHCRHCNMRVSPAATRAWHERMCRLNSGHIPSLCEMCYRPFTSLAHARNHYLYGCTPVV